MSAAYEALKARAAAHWRLRSAPARPLVRVDLTTSSVAANADALLSALRRIAAGRGIDCEIIAVGSTGLSYLEPVVEVQQPGKRPAVYGPVPPQDAAAFLDDVIARGRPGARWAIGVRGGAQDGLPALEDHPFWRGQERRLMEWYGLIDPESIEDAIGTGAYGALETALAMAPPAICDLVEASGLGGRGGGGFPAGRKWKFLLGAAGHPKYLILNADEGDPGAFVNRVLMESDPHTVIEGMIIAARATGADHGFIYIRDEYPLSVRRMERATGQARAAGLLGADVLGSGLAFDLSVVRGAGSYVCGEETGLIASLEGLRGMPKIRPPFPAQRGAFGAPSNVNNTETYANVPLVLRRGADWYRQLGTASDPGTKMFSINGAIQRTGVVEVPFGFSMERLLNGIGGGVPAGHAARGIQPGGPLGGVLPADSLGLALERPPFSERGVLLGSGGLILFDERTCPLDLALYFSEFCEDESCGRCTTCHGGSQRLVEILQRIQQGGGQPGDLERIGILDRTLQNANCLHGQFTPYAIRAVVRHFRASIEAHIRERRCPDRVCPGLIRYRLADPRHPALADAAAYLNDGALIPDGEGGWTLRADAALASLECAAEMAAGAFMIEDRFPGHVPVVAAAGAEARPG